MVSKHSEYTSILSKPPMRHEADFAQAMVLLPRKYRIDLRVNICKSQRRYRDGGFYRNHRDDALRNFILATKSDYESNPTSSMRLHDLVRIYERVIKENRAEREYNKTRIEEHRWADYGLPYSDDTVTLISGICLLLDRLDMAEVAIQMVEKRITGSSASAIAVYFPRCKFERLRA